MSMRSPVSLGLLPEGLRDVLPPQAEAEARLLRSLLDHLASHGYERVGTPVIEFEDSLTDGFGAARAADLFRLTDPISQRPLAVRSDITGQIARVAATRLGHYPRPLRLSYAGPVLRIRGSQLRADRQFLQAGAELIGSDAPRAVAEIAELAIAGLLGMGLEQISIDFVLPDLVRIITKSLGLSEEETKAVIVALDAKDAAAVAALPHARVFQVFYEATGNIADVLTAAEKSAHAPEQLKERLRVLSQLVDGMPQDPRVSLTVDPGETRGFDYQTWIGFSLFAKGIRGEVGRGGTYLIHRADSIIEPAVGFSLYLDGLVEAGRGVATLLRILLPFDTDPAVGERLRTQGWATVCALEVGAAKDQARDQRCSHFWDGQSIQSLS